MKTHQFYLLLSVSYVAPHLGREFGFTIGGVCLVAALWYGIFRND